MASISEILNSNPPKTISDALRTWPQKNEYHPSPTDWRDKVFYFLLPDRFSNGMEKPENLLKFDLYTGKEKIRALRGSNWRWDRWLDSGRNRYQGGTLKGIKSKLDYLKELGISTIWIAPIFRQRVELNTYHGYGIQNFFDIDPRFGTRKDLVELVDEAHQKGMYIILDVIFNHSGCNWLYDKSTGNQFQPPYLPYGSYSPIWPRNGYGSEIYNIKQTLGPDDYVWPSDFQDETKYMRAGSGNLGAGDTEDDYAEHKRTDFCDLRKFNLFFDNTLSSLILSYQYWIALADIDGFRIDTFKHVTLEQARNFCNGIKEYAESLGKDDFFLVAEVAGGNSAQDKYLDVTGRNLNACLDIGEQRETLCNVAKGLQKGTNFFGGFCYYDQGMGSHRNYGSRHLSISNDHDHVFGSKIRFSADASNDHQAAVAIALQLFTLGIPCIYYGTEQGLASGAEPEERCYISNRGGDDCLLREAMFGPVHPRASGYDGTQGKLDESLPGFGPHGTAGYHVFNKEHPVYRRISLLAFVRAALKPLRRGRQYQREISFLGLPFSFYGPGEILAWSRIFDDQEVLVVINTHGVEKRGAAVTIDRNLSKEGMIVVENTDPFAPQEIKRGAVISARESQGRYYLGIDKWLLGPSEVIVLANRAAFESAGEFFKDLHWK